MTEASVSFAGYLTDDPEVRYTEAGMRRLWQDPRHPDGRATAVGSSSLCDPPSRGVWH
jgi:single-stranded DNA-binding protein